MLNGIRSAPEIYAALRREAGLNGKAAHEVRFAETLERVACAGTSQSAESLIDRVEKSADGDGGVKFPDFPPRPLPLLQISVKAFGETPAVAINPCPAVTINLIHDQLKRVIGFASAVDVKALPAAPVGELLPAPKQIPPERKN